MELGNVLPLVPALCPSDVNSVRSARAGRSCRDVRVLIPPSARLEGALPPLIVSASVRSPRNALLRRLFQPSSLGRVTRNPSHVRSVCPSTLQVNPSRCDNERSVSARRSRVRDARTLRTDRPQVADPLWPGGSATDR
jgi:hypothetical protein